MMSGTFFCTGLSAQGMNLRQGHHEALTMKAMHPKSIFERHHIERSELKTDSWEITWIHVTAKIRVLLRRAATELWRTLRVLSVVDQREVRGTQRGMRGRERGTD